MVSPAYCTPGCTREYATQPARNWMPTARHGLSRLIAVAKANAAAEWPDGKDVDDGILTCRAPGTPAPARSGRCRAETDLIPRLTTAEVTAIARTPRTAARLPAGPVRARPAATPSQSLDWLAELDSRRKAWSREGVGTSATAA